MKNTIITTEVPVITDATYDLTRSENKEKDIVVVLTKTEPIESIEVDGAKITGTNLQKETVIKTTLREKKAKINELQGYIEGNIRANLVWQHELDALNLELPDIQSAVDEALVGWNVKPILPVEKPLAEVIK